jgi:hypothetical protein
MCSPPGQLTAPVARPTSTRREVTLKTAMAVLVAAVVLAGCGTSTATHKSTLSPSSTASADPAAAAIQQAVTAECTKFQAANSDIEQATASDHTVGDLMSTVSTDAITWSKELGRAAKAANAPGAPTGSNRAQTLAGAIDNSAVKVSRLGLDVAFGRSGAVRNDWSAVQDALNQVTMKCP